MSDDNRVVIEVEVKPHANNPRVWKAVGDEGQKAHDKAASAAEKSADRQAKAAERAAERSIKSQQRASDQVGKDLDKADKYFEKVSQNRLKLLGRIADEERKRRDDEARQAQKAEQLAEREGAKKERELQRAARAAERAAQQETAARERQAVAAVQAHRRAQAAEDRVVTSARAVLSSVLEIGRGFVLLGAHGEKNLEELVKTFAKFQGFADIFKGTLGLVDEGEKLWRAYRHAALEAAVAERVAAGVSRRTAIAGIVTDATAAGGGSAAARVAAGVGAGFASRGVIGGIAGGVSSAGTTGVAGLIIATAAAVAVAGRVVIESLNGLLGAFKGSSWNANNSKSWTTKIGTAEADAAIWLDRKTGGYLPAAGPVRNAAKEQEKTERFEKELAASREMQDRLSQQDAMELPLRRAAQNVKDEIGIDMAGARASARDRSMERAVQEGIDNEFRKDTRVYKGKLIDTVDTGSTMTRIRMLQQMAGSESQARLDEGLNQKRAADEHAAGLGARIEAGQGRSITYEALSDAAQGQQSAAERVLNLTKQRLEAEKEANRTALETATRLVDQKRQEFKMARDLRQEAEEAGKNSKLRFSQMNADQQAAAMRAVNKLENGKKLTTEEYDTVTGLGIRSLTEKVQSERINQFDASARGKQYEDSIGKYDKSDRAEAGSREVALKIELENAVKFEAELKANEDTIAKKVVDFLVPLQEKLIQKVNEAVELELNRRDAATRSRQESARAAQGGK